MIVAGMAIAAGASLLGGFLANRGKRQEAQKDRNFQEKMSSTSWQRGVEDMTAAGLNPALAYSRGGASTPGGAMAGQEDPVTGAVSSALQAKRLKKELEVMEQEKQRIYSDNKLKANQAVEAAARTQLVHRQQETAEISNEQLQLQFPWLRAQSGAAQRYGTQAAVMQMIMNSGGSNAVGLLGTLGGAGILRSVAKGARGVGGVFRPRRVKFTLPAGGR